MFSNKSNSDLIAKFVFDDSKSVSDCHQLYAQSIVLFKALNTYCIGVHYSVRDLIQ